MAAFRKRFLAVPPENSNFSGFPRGRIHNVWKACLRFRVSESEMMKKPVSIESMKAKIQKAEN